MATKLREASFRGVAFDVSQTTLKVGRRVVVFEYPQQDKPFVEDLGKSARTISMTASVSGTDYISRMKKLIAACEKQGSGKLIDPWLGSMTVTPKSLSSPVFSSLNYAEITLEFVESGEYKFPSGLLNTSKLCQSLSAIVGENALSNFLSKFDLTNASETVKNLLGTSLSETLPGLTVDNLFDLADGVAELVSDVTTLIEGSASVIGQRILDTFGLSGYASSIASWTNVAKDLASLCKSSSLTDNSAATTVQYSETTTSTVDEAETEIQDLIRQVLVADLILAAANVGTDSDRVTESAPAVVMAYDDMIEVRDTILDVIDAEMLLCTSDDLYSALEQARSAVYQDMTERAEGKAKLVDYKPSATLPALVLAYDYYGDATRDAEIIERNGIRHGGFVPATTLKMLNE